MDRARVTELLFRAIDNELDNDEQQLLRQQVETCADCAREAAYVEQVVYTVRARCSRLRAPASLRLRILSQFQHRRSQPE